MNTSPYINPALCRDCGDCCEHLDIWYPKNAHALIRSEIDRFKLLKDIGDKISTIEEEDGTWLRFDIPCKFLHKDDGAYWCEIYSDIQNRPLICMQYPHSEDDCCQHIKERSE